MDLEATLQRLADLQAASRAVVWEQADLIAHALPAGRSSVPGKVAETLGCSSAWVRQLARVAKAFSPDDRHEDVPFGLYLVAARAPEPKATLQLALAEGWSSAELARNLRVTQRNWETGRCPACGKVLSKKDVRPQVMDAGQVVDAS